MVLWVQDLWPESLSATGCLRNKAALAAVVRFIYRHVQLLLVQLTYAPFRDIPKLESCCYRHVCDASS